MRNKPDIRRSSFQSDLGPVRTGDWAPYQPTRISAPLRHHGITGVGGRVIEFELHRVNANSMAVVMAPPNHV